MAKLERKFGNKILISKHYFPLKRNQGLLEGKSASRTGAGKVEDAPRIFCCARNQGSTQRTMWTCQRNTEANFKGLPLARSGTILASK